MLAGREGACYVYYIGYSRAWGAWIGYDRVQPFASQGLLAGTAISVEWNGHWYAARVLRSYVGLHLIRYEGYGDEWDEWVLPRRLTQYPVRITILASSVSGRRTARHQPARPWCASRSFEGAHGHVRLHGAAGIDDAVDDRQHGVVTEHAVDLSFDVGEIGPTGAQQKTRAGLATRAGFCLTFLVGA